MFSTFFQKIVPFMKKMGEKYASARQVTDDNMAHALCMPDKLRLQADTQNM